MLRAPQLLTPNGSASFNTSATRQGLQVFDVLSFIAKSLWLILACLLSSDYVEDPEGPNNIRYPVLCLDGATTLSGIFKRIIFALFTNRATPCVLVRSEERWTRFLATGESCFRTIAGNLSSPGSFYGFAAIEFCSTFPFATPWRAGTGKHRPSSIFIEVRDIINQLCLNRNRK